MSEEMKTLVEAISDLRSQGYTNDFSQEDGLMYIKESGKSYNPDDLVIEKVLRFEGDSNPDDMSVLYGIAASDGAKGIIIDAYGAYEDAGISDFIKKVRLKNDY
jgi:hypothetical protein